MIVGYMKRKQSKQLTTASENKPALLYDNILAGMIDLLENARRAAARAVNSIMTATYWEIGRRIVEVEQGGEARAEYGEQLLENLSHDLTARFGRGFSIRNLRSFRAFYRTYQIRQTLSAELTPSSLTKFFPLSWSHYVALLSVENEQGREFYETEALRGGWSVRQLNRQIGTQFFERTALSKDKAAMLTKGAKPKPEDLVTPEEEIKSPYVLEFLDLKDEYSESELEEALINHLEKFLLELGGDFTFVGRQKRLRIGDHWFRVDLVFFHRRLRALLIVDLKLDKFTHADVGQMHLYCNYAKHHWVLPGENPPIGLILCASKDNTLAEYALEGLPNKIMVSKYLTALPDKKLLEGELVKTRRLLEERKEETAAIRPAGKAEKRPSTKKSAKAK